MKLAALFATLSVALMAQNYTAQTTTQQGISVIRLADAAKGVEISIVPSIGNRVTEMKVHGKNILYFPVTDLAELKSKPALNGIPFLAPWGNRLDAESFWANDKNYPFNMTLGNVRGPIPIHGLLSSSDLWEVMEVAADGKSAHVTSRLRFWKYPQLMAQWPFAHEYEITYRLAEGVLELQATVTNLSAEPMPIALAFHPYYRIADVPRDQWIAKIPARKIVIADSRLVATGEFKPYDMPDPLPLKDHPLDTGFTDLERDSDGRAHFSIEAAGMKVETLFGPKYPVAVIYAPPAPEGQTRDFICFEPMTGITNAINLHHAGKYPDLQTVAPGAKWTESFWVRTSGI
jgi:aldose 1-epimerase